ncbi:hypothetical protein DESC_970050 [Desulfosarcina cetonica]|nr:hypothetical protein DESC_970050 [Desulfosarcina cetonica]
MLLARISIEWTCMGSSPPLIRVHPEMANLPISGWARIHDLAFGYTIIAKCQIVNQSLIGPRYVDRSALIALATGPGQSHISVSIDLYS